MKKNALHLVQIISMVWIALTIGMPAFAQKKKKAQDSSVATTDVKPAFAEDLYNAIEWRDIGPYRGGRSAAVTGVSGKPNLYYC